MILSKTVAAGEPYSMVYNGSQAVFRSNSQRAWVILSGSQPSAEKDLIYLLEKIDVRRYTATLACQKKLLYFLTERSKIHDLGSG
jgi:hypothetical protein